jgi:hypothetical protein
MTKAALALATAVAISAIAATSHAANFWNVNATSCVPDAGSIQGNLYMGTGGTIKFAPGKTGNIVLYCPVSFRLGFKPHVLGVTYYDDTSSPGNHVSVQLIKMEVGTGTITSIVTAHSKSSPVSTNGKAATTAQEFTDTYNPNDFAYYLRIDLVRNSPAANEIVYLVSLLD